MPSFVYVVLETYSNEFSAVFTSQAKAEKYISGKDCKNAYYWQQEYLNQPSGYPEF